MKDFIINHLRDIFIDYFERVVDNDMLFANTCNFYSFIKSSFIDILDNMEVLEQ